MSVKITNGNRSNDLVDIDAYHQLKVVTPQTEISAGFASLSTEIDAGSILGSRDLKAIESSDDYRVRVGSDQTVFNATFEGSVILTTHFYSFATTTGSVQANGVLTVNSAAIAAMITSGAAAYVRTWRTFPTFGTYPIYVDMWISIGGPLAVNAISEWGLLYLLNQATQQPIDGIFFRCISGGQLKGIITSNQIDITQITLDTRNVPSRDGYGLFKAEEINHYLIVVDNNIVKFWINDVLVGSIRCPSSQSQFSNASALPVGFRTVNTAVPSTIRQINVGCVNVGFGDQNTDKPWSHAMVGSGGGSYHLHVGNTPGPTVTRASASTGHPASATARTAGTWTATSAPALNNLGGLWTSPAISTLTSDADYPVFAFQNPIGTAARPGKTLYITGVRIGDTVPSVGASTNPIFISYIVTVGSSASATNTSDSATTVSGKSIVIGGHGFLATDAAGAHKPGFNMEFTSPLVIPAGHFINLIVRPFGTVTGNTLVLRGSVSFDGYFE
jgi:hypothetical protein